MSSKWVWVLSVSRFYRRFLVFSFATLTFLGTNFHRINKIPPGRIHKSIVGRKIIIAAFLQVGFIHTLQCYAWIGVANINFTVFINSIYSIFNITL